MVAEPQLRALASVIEGADQIIASLAEVGPAIVVGRYDQGRIQDGRRGAALFATQPGVAWVTGGLEDRVVRNEEPALVWAVVAETAAFLVTTNIEQPRLVAEHDLTGFELHAVPWYSSGGLAEVVESLAGGLKLAEPPAALRSPAPG